MRIADADECLGCLDGQKMKERYSCGINQASAAVRRWLIIESGRDARLALPFNCLVVFYMVYPRDHGDASQVLPSW